MLHAVKEERKEMLKSVCKGINLLCWIKNDFYFKDRYSLQSLDADLLYSYMWEIFSYRE